MKGEIIEKIMLDEQEEQTILWFYKKGFTWLCISEAMGGPVSEVQFFDDEYELLSVYYTDWQGIDLVALMDKSGDVLVQGISSIEEYIKGHGLFVATINASHISRDWFYQYSLEEDDEYWIVLDLNGRVKIEPTCRLIVYEEDDNAFHIGRGDNLDIIHLDDLK